MYMYARTYVRTYVLPARRGLNARMCSWPARLRILACAAYRN